MEHIFKIVHDLHSLLRHSLLEGKKDDLHSRYLASVSSSPSPLIHSLIDNSARA